MSRDNWDGEATLRVGHVVRYGGTPDSSFYALPEYGQKLTLIARDKQMFHNDVWICRWYDSDGRINLVPLLPHVLLPFEEPIDPRAQEVADRYYQWTGVDLDVRALQKSLASLLQPEHNVVAPKEKSEYLEVTFLGDGDFGALENVKFPITLRLSKTDYRVLNIPHPAIEISGQILNFIPGVKSNTSFGDTEYYVFYKDEEVLYKE